jgi:hypothetical protein
MISGNSSLSLVAFLCLEALQIDFKSTGIKAIDL